MDSFIRKGFYTFGALKTNRIIYPCGIRQKVSEFAIHLRKEDRNVNPVTVNNRNFYVYRYEGELKLWYIICAVHIMGLTAISKKVISISKEKSGKNR